MSRCKHCNMLTHSERLNVYFDMRDADKVEELFRSEHWKSVWEYSCRENDQRELGYLKCGDIYIHFMMNPIEEKP